MFFLSAADGSIHCAVERSGWLNEGGQRGQDGAVPIQAVVGYALDFAYSFLQTTQ